MCGLAGIYRPGGVVREEELRAMARALFHRGPDAQAIVAAGEVGFAHARLKVVDLSERAAQPMVSASGRSTLVFNGEIYNHHALRRTLEQRGVRFRSTSDTEVLLEGFETFGAGILGRLEGMFAFAVWDAEKRALFLARDRAGEKPLFYHPLPGGGLAFASEIKALLALPALGIERDLGQIATFLRYGYVAPPATFYRGVVHLEPAHYVEVEKRKPLQARRYWAPRFNGSGRPPTYADAKHQLRHMLSGIVRDRLEADVPVGIFLSGGLDSTAVAGIASRDLGRLVHTFSIGFDDPGMDESSDARSSAAHLGTRHEEFIVDHRDIPSIDLLVHHHDGPFADSSGIPTYLVSKMARDRVTVALTGDGGDEVFGGYTRFVGGQLAEQLPRWAGTAALRAVHALANGGGHPVLEAIPGPIGAKSVDLVQRLERIAASVERPLEARMAHWTEVFGEEQLASVLRGDAAAALSESRRFFDEAFDQSAGMTALGRMLDFNFRTYLPEDLLVKVDRCSMAVSLETRCPFLDSELVDFVGSLPDEFKVRGLTTKRILRDALHDLYPPHLLQRPKRGFGIPLARWLQGPLRERLEDAILTDRAEIYRFLDRKSVERLVFDPSAENRGRWHQAWSLWTLEVWLRSRPTVEVARPETRV